MKQAKLIKDGIKSESGANQIIVELPNPIGYDRDWDTGEITKETKYVLVSAVNVMFSGPETYIFPCDKEGNVLNWGELDGSMRRTLDHEKALRNMGYELKSWHAEES